MKKLILAMIVLSSIAQASAGVLVCTGSTHTVTIDSSKSTILVSPEMKTAVPAVIGAGPEEGLSVAYDKGETFLAYISERNGKSFASLSSATDEDEEVLICTGAL